MRHSDLGWRLLGHNPRSTGIKIGLHQAKKVMHIEWNTQQTKRGNQ